jgi:ATP-binding cassette subfamily B protein/subfamily B ATP-binding cassette protein MsbA
MMGFTIALDVLRPWPMKLLVDQVLGKQALPPSLTWLLVWLPGSATPDGLLFWVCLSTVLIFLAGTVASTASGIAEVSLGQEMTYHLGADLFRHLQQLSLIFHSRSRVGDIAERVTGDAYCVRVLVIDALLPLVQSLGTLVAMFFVLWQLQPTMTLVSLFIVPFQGFVIWTYSKPMKARNRQTRDLEGRMMALVHQVLSAVPAVQAFSREDEEHHRFQAIADDTVRAYRHGVVASMGFKLFAGLVTAFGTAVMMGIGAEFALQGRLTIGSILVFLAYLSSLYEPINSITQMFATLQQSAASTDRVLEILDTPVDVSDAPGARGGQLTGGIRYQDIRFGYVPGQAVLNGISFGILPGEVVAIVGPTGAGKTTLVSLLLRFFDPWSGAVSVEVAEPSSDGSSWLGLRDLQTRGLRQQIAIVLQEPFIFPMTIAENISYGRPDASSDEVVAAAIAANADDFIRRLPQGYDTVVGERGSTLSGGEKQRLSIARAFLKDAPILILDEPTSALDAHTEARLLDALERLMARRTTLIIAHRLSTIRTANRILVVDRGEIVESGRHTELLTREGLYASLYRQQLNIAQHDLVTVDVDGC